MGGGGQASFWQFASSHACIGSLYLLLPILLKSAGDPAFSTSTFLSHSRLVFYCQFQNYNSWGEKEGLWTQGASETG